MSFLAHLSCNPIFPFFPLIQQPLEIRKLNNKLKDGGDVQPE